MCLSLPGRITQINGALAEVVEQDGRVQWCNALAQPDARVGDYALTHANLLVAIISADEAAEMLEAARELQMLIDADMAGEMAGGARLPANAAQVTPQYEKR